MTKRFIRCWIEHLALLIDERVLRDSCHWIDNLAVELDRFGRFEVDWVNLLPRCEVGEAPLETPNELVLSEFGD